MKGWMNEWMNEWMNAECKDEWKEGWMKKWMNNECRNVSVCSVRMRKDVSQLKKLSKNISEYLIKIF